MIVIDPSEAPNSPGEQSPLKGGNLSPPVSAPLPPPPYRAAPIPQPTPPQYYQSTSTHPQVPLVEQSRHRHPRSTFKRFIKAFAVATLVLFLWGILIDSFEVTVVGRRKNKPRISTDLVGWGLNRWHHNTEPAPLGCPCQPAEVPTTPGRVLPIEYPPVIRVPQVKGVSLPTPPS